MDRRAFLKAAGGAVAGAGVIGVLNPKFANAADPGASPFTLGVASGDPTHEGVILWTRLAPDPLVPGGGMPSSPVEVDWEVALDDTFRRIARRGRTVAVPEDAHSVHLPLHGLRADATYWYRFRTTGPGGERQISPVGRTRTAPAPWQRPHRVRFATASCQNYQDGYYTAHRALAAEEDLAFVTFLGDYIYEGRPSATALRSHDGVGEPLTLDEYRGRHARYRSDADLQANHAAHPWIVTFDDHEVDNNWASTVPQDPALQTPEAFLARRTAAFKAYWEHMPLHPRLRPSGAGTSIQVYRRFAWADLLQLDVLDTRQFRSDQPTDLAGANNPAATMMGAEQEAWLHKGLKHSRALWNVVAQQTMVAQNDRTAGPAETFDFDNWDGYRAARQRLLADLAQVENPVVVTGDRHATWVSDLKQDFYDPASATIAAELTGTSISSGGDGNRTSFHATYDPIKVDSPHWKFIDNGRGYLLCDVDRQRMLTDLRNVSTVRSPSATVATYARFVTEAGRRGVEVA